MQNDIKYVPKHLHARKKKLEDYYKYMNDLKILCKAKHFTLPESNFRVVFYIPMPKSWSNKKKLEMINQPCKTKPDRDNYMKAFQDALSPGNDAHIWDAWTTKLWSDVGQIDVYKIMEV